MNVKIFGKETENQINGQLGAEIDQNQSAQQSVGNAVHFTESYKQNRGYAENGCHGKVGVKAGQTCSVEIGGFGCHRYSPIGYYWGGSELREFGSQLETYDKCIIQKLESKS